MNVAPRPLVLGVLGRPRMPDEHRVPLHPAHLERIPPQLRSRIILEEGYGERFGWSDAQCAPFVGAILSRADLIARADIVLLAKPLADDLRDLRDGQTLWGWPHSVQDIEMTQIAIDKRLTLIAFEAMTHGVQPGGLHVFHKNNEIAGYASVLHALTLAGRSGDYGRRMSAVVIGFGATARGAVTALTGQGIHDVRVLTNRMAAAVAAPIHSAEIVHFDHDAGPDVEEVIIGGKPQRLARYLAESDIVVNCTFQDPLRPLVYVRTGELVMFRPSTLIVDVSCDTGMAFEWARPTSFQEPMRVLDGSVHYYAVPHSPSWLWDSASWEIGEALLPFLETVLGGPNRWAADPVIARAIDIQDGVIRNTDILDFQSRGRRPPHLRMG